MTKTTTFLIYVLTCAFGSVYGQTKINDFEAGSPTTISRYGSNVSIVSNPNTVGNTTANCAKIGRTTSNWYELIAFPASFMVPANTSKYLHVLVNYPAQPDLSVRFDAANENADGSADVRALNTYTTFNQWQDLVFQVDGGANGQTINAIIFITDAGFNNVPSGQVLNNTNAFGYIDEFSFSDSSLSTLSIKKEFVQNNNVDIYPNPVESVFKLQTNTNVNITDVSLYNILGKEVAKNINRINTSEYDVSNLSSGLYIVKITDKEGHTTSKRLIKK